MTRHIILAALALALAAPPAALAQPWPDGGRPGVGGGRGGPESARDAVRSGRQAPLSRVLAMIAARYPGRHLNTSQDQMNGRPVYVVQWQMLDGRVVIFIVDAESGAILSRQGG